jgi:hypothetical protein
MSQLVGRQVYALAKRHNQGVVRETFWGLIVLWFAGWIPYVGPIVKVLAVVLGLGGVFFSRFGTRTKGLHVPPPPMEQPPRNRHPRTATRRCLTGYRLIHEKGERISNPFLHLFKNFLS